MDADPVYAPDLVRSVDELAEAFALRGVRHALIGGLATSIRGRPRYTQDVDFLVDVPQIALPGLLDDLEGRGFTLDAALVIKQYVREHITKFAFGEVRIDWLKPVLPFYDAAVADATPVEWSKGRSIRVAPVESLILTKMVAFRPQDRSDIETLLTANRDAIDLDSIREDWAPFAEAEVERTAWLEAEIAERVTRRESITPRPEFLDGRSGGATEPQ